MVERVAKVVTLDVTFLRLCTIVLMINRLRFLTKSGIAQCFMVSSGFSTEIFYCLEILICYTPTHSRTPREGLDFKGFMLLRGKNINHEQIIF